MEYVELVIRGISFSQTQTGAYALLLEQPLTNVKLPVVIGNFEAQAISLGLEKDIQPSRPLTHDLFSKFILLSQYRLVSVVIYQIIDGVFFSNINFVNDVTGDEMMLDARTSDAVALAVRFNAPIYTTPEVLDVAGIMLDIEEKAPAENVAAAADDAEDDITPEEVSFEDYSTSELQELLDQAVKAEDFDTAMEIQEILKKRNKKID